MTVPTPDFDFSDLSTGFTENGSPVYVDGQHGDAGSHLDPDGSTDWLDYAAKAVTSADGGNLTVSFWNKCIDGSTTRYLVAQDSTGPGGATFGFHIYWGTGDQLVCIAGNWPDGPDSVQSRYDNASADALFGKWVHYTVTFSGADCNIYTNGTEVSSYGVQNSVNGSGYVGVPAGVEDLSIGARGDGSAFLDSQIGRVKIWKDTALTPAEVLEHYEAERDAVVLPTADHTYNDMTDVSFTANGTPVAAKGQHDINNTTYDFDGSNDYLTHPDAPFNGSARGTVSFWCYDEHLGAAQTYPGGQRITTDTTDFYYIPMTSTDFSFILQTSSGNQIKSTPKAINVLNRWVHWAISWDLEDQKVHIVRDGVDQDVISSAVGAPATVLGVPTNIVIGAIYNDVGAANHDGRTERWNMFEDVALSPAQLLKHYNEEADARRAMAFPRDITSVYWMEETSGAPTDGIGNDDMNALFGGAYSSGELYLDGVNEYFESPTGLDQFIDNTGDYTVYVHGKGWELGSGNNKNLLRPTNLSATKQGPTIALNFNQNLGRVGFLSHSAAGTAAVTLEMGRDFNDEEEVVFMFSYEASTRTISAHIRTDGGIDESGSASGTADPGWAAGDKYQWCRNGSNIETEFTFLEIGAVDGIAKTAAEMEAAIDSVIAPAAGAAPAPIGRDTIRRHLFGSRDLAFRGVR